MADFDDSKDEGALRTIGEVAGATGIKTHVLRYWEQQFPQLQPLKRSGGRRYYRPGDIALVEKIDELVNRQGYTLKGAKAALKEARGGPRLTAMRLLLRKRRQNCHHKRNYRMKPSANSKQFATICSARWPTHKLVLIV